MPKWPTHKFIDRLYLGKEFPKVHEGLDWPAQYLKRRHRIYFHNLLSAYLVAREKYPGDPDADWSAILHVWTDEACSKDPKYRKLLERMEILDRKKKKQTSRRKKNKTELAKLLEYQAKQNANFEKFLRQSKKNMDKIYGTKKRKRKSEKKKNPSMHLTKIKL